jgi:outer membrane protein TolC
VRLDAPIWALLGLAICLASGQSAAAQSLPEARHNVRIGPIASRADADSTLDVLRAEAIDFHILPAARDGRFEISVGVYAVLANAERMLDRVRALGLEPSQIVSVGVDSGRTETPPPAKQAAGGERAAIQEVSTQPVIYEVRYGWFSDRETAVDVYHSLVDSGFVARLLVFRDSGGITLGLGVFDAAPDADRQVEELAEQGFPLGRVYPVDQTEAQGRRIADAPTNEQPAIDEPQIPPDDQPSAPAPLAIADTSPVNDPGAAQTTTITASAETSPGDPSPTPSHPQTTAQARVPSAGVDVPYRLMLTDAVEYALAHSPELESESLNLDLSETDLRRAWGLVQPKIFFEHTSTRNDPDTVEYFNRLPDGANLLLGELGLPPTVPPFMFEDAHHTRFLLTQNLFSGGANRSRISGARAHRDATESHRDDRQAEILMHVLQAFFDLARQGEVVDLRDESLARAERSLESVQRRFSLGLVARADVLRWQVQVSGERVQLIEAKNIYDVGHEHFKRLIGYPPYAPLELAFLTLEQIDRLMVAGISELEHDVRSADDQWLEDHPAVASASKNADAARYQRKASSSDFWPTLDLDGSVGYLENDTIELDEFMQWSVRLRLTLSIWDGGARVQNRAEARTIEDLAKLNLRVVRDELFVQDRSVVADLRADLAALENAQAAVAQAAETMESVTNKAALGLADYIQRIDAQVILTQSQVAETSARYQFVIDLFRWWRVRDPERLEYGALP